MLLVAVVTVTVVVRSKIMLLACVGAVVMVLLAEALRGDGMYP